MRCWNAGGISLVAASSIPTLFLTDTAHPPLARPVPVVCDSVGHRCHPETLAFATIALTLAVPAVFSSCSITMSAADRGSTVAAPAVGSVSPSLTMPAHEFAFIVSIAQSPNGFHQLSASSVCKTMPGDGKRLAAAFQ